MKLKVCGMREKKNIISLTDLKPNYVGFIFWISSTRYVDQSTPSLPEAIKKTGVFVDATIDFIQSMVQNHQLKAVQLHGEETCLLYTSPSPRDLSTSRMPSSA